MVAMTEPMQESATLHNHPQDFLSAVGPRTSTKRIEQQDKSVCNILRQNISAMSTASSCVNVWLRRHKVVIEVLTPELAELQRCNVKDVVVGGLGVMLGCLNFEQLYSMGLRVTRLLVEMRWETMVDLVLRYKNRTHVLRPELYRWSTVGPAGHLLLPDKIAGFCKAHGFEAYDNNAERPRKVYDLFLLSTELDWLEIRLHTLSPFVDYFVIVESTTTFTGIPKPAYLADNWDKFAAFHDKIIHRIVPDPGSSVGSRTWDREDYFRNALFDKVFPLQAEQQANHGDVLVVSDIDEIPKPETLVVLRKCDFPSRLTLRSPMYYYSFQWLHRAAEDWAHPQATVYKGMDNTISPKDLRNGEGPHGWFFLGDLYRWLNSQDFWNAAWHCSSCFATVKEMQTKMESFSHSPWNTAENRDPKTIVERVRNGLDLFGREGEVYEKVEDHKDVPAYVVQQKSKFGYLLDRDPPNAGFTDWPMGAQTADETSIT